MTNAIKTPVRQQEPEQSQQKRSHRVLEKGLHLLIARHLYAAMTSLGRMSREPLATLMTVSVIGLSLALPMGLFLILNTAEELSIHWEEGTHISLYLNQDVNEKEASSLVNRLRINPDIADVRYISPQEGLENFQRYSGFGSLLNNLPENPLPGLIEVKPVVLNQTPHVVEHLLQQLEQLPDVEMAQLDMQWVKRLYGIIAVTKRALAAIGLLLAIGVILVVGNTIRLATERYRDEIEVISLVGGTKAFIRRPFLYIGAFYGAFGGIITWLCVDFTLLWLQGPVDNLAALYNSRFQFQELGLSAMLLLVCLGGFLGLMGAFIAVQKHLRQLMIESLRA